MLCTPVFIFTSGSSALLGHPHCGLSIWLLFLAMSNTFFWDYADLFHDKTWKYSKSDMKMAANVNTGVQSINTERASSFLFFCTFLLIIGFAPWQYITCKPIPHNFETNNFFHSILCLNLLCQHSCVDGFHVGPSIIIKPFHWHVSLSKLKIKFAKTWTCSVTTWTPPLESTHQVLSFEWSHL